MFYVKYYIVQVTTPRITMIMQVLILKVHIELNTSKSTSTIYKQVVYVYI